MPVAGVRVEIAFRPLLHPAVLRWGEGKPVHTEICVVAERVTVEWRYLDRLLFHLRVGRVAKPSKIGGPQSLVILCWIRELIHQFLCHQVAWRIGAEQKINAAVDPLVADKPGKNRIDASPERRPLRGLHWPF